ncbi:MAG: shikimate kinase [Acidimicrobiales bacterium]
MGDERVADDDTRHVVLVGMMGAGKTTVGRDLAMSLNRPFFDTDEVVVKSVDRSVRDIFEQDGEPAFRKLEAQALADLLMSSTPSVIATGGGAVLAKGSRENLKRSAVVVWLRASYSLLAARVSGSSKRPLLDVKNVDTQDGNTESVLAEMCIQREPFYQEVAHHVIDVDGRGSRHTVKAVLELIS